MVLRFFGDKGIKLELISNDSLIIKAVTKILVLIYSFYHKAHNIKRVHFYTSIKHSIRGTAKYDSG